jgi:hypothetical protein
MKINCTTWFTSLIAFNLATFSTIWPQGAQAQHSDIFLASVGGQVAVGGANDLGTVDENYDLTTRLFEGLMVPDFPPFDPADYGRDEPGVVALPAGHLGFPAGASALPTNAAVSVSFPTFTVAGNVDSLFYWDGVGSVDFEPASIAQPGVSFSLDNDPIGNTSDDGDLHVHPAFQIDNGGAGVPDDGVYLVAPIASVVGLDDSERFYMVWLVDALITDDEAAEEVEEAIEAGTFEALGKNFEYFEHAAEYVQSNLIVPEPVSGAIIAIAMGVIVGRWRERRGARRMSA